MNNYFCVLPFFSKEISVKKKATSCCLLPDDHDITQIQSKMLNKERPTDCNKCWYLEDQGLISDRQIKNGAFDFYSNKSIEIIEEQCKKGDFSPQIIKLYTSNLCNSTCVTCGPSASTKWQSLKNITIQKNIVDDLQLDNIDWKELKMLSFVGGEPLLEKKNLDIIQTLSEVNPDCFIDIVTNGSVNLSNKQKRSLSKLKNLNICMSIDGIGKQFEYIRYPLKWSNVVSNIKQYRELGAMLSVSFTVSNLNILYYDQIIKWFKSQSLPYNHIIVEYPPEFNIEVLPPEIKKNLPLVKNKTTFDKDLFKNFVKHIKFQDQLKNISINDYLPELAKVIDEFHYDVSSLVD